MSSRVPLDALFAAYLHDLAELARLARKEQEEGLRSAQSLVGKLVLESVRVSVYERVFLLPVVADVLPDGSARAQSAVGALDSLETRAAALEGLDHSSADALAPLTALVDVVEDLARDQLTTLLPAVAEALPERDLMALGERVTPTMESGATHSHPKVTGGHDLTLWPQRGVTKALRDVLSAEAATR
ncbi:hypothetical protein [Motilibacter peucedani]|nr:hypothetical protein [Motilibacter peucedani]